MAALATAFALGGGGSYAVAAGLIDGGDVKNNSLTGMDIKDHSIKAIDLGTSLRGPRGYRGLTGPQGLPGEAAQPYVWTGTTAGHGSGAYFAEVISADDLPVGAIVQGYSISITDASSSPCQLWRGSVALGGSGLGDAQFQNGAQVAGHFGYHQVVSATARRLQAQFDCDFTSQVSPVVDFKIVVLVVNPPDLSSATQIN